MTARRKALALFGSALLVAGGAAAARAARAQRPARVLLEGPALLIPVEGIDAGAIRDNFREPRGKRVHRALDIMAKRGTPVLAAIAGRVVKLREHPLGGICLYQYDEAEEWAFYYAHLDAYAKGLTEGSRVKAGDVIGYVGTTGNAPPTAPHLHFAMMRLGPGKRWYGGTPVNPFPYFRKPG